MTLDRPKLAAARRRKPWETTEDDDMAAERERICVLLLLEWFWMILGSVVHGSECMRDGLVGKEKKKKIETQFIKTTGDFPDRVTEKVPKLSSTRVLQGKARFEKIICKIVPPKKIIQSVRTST